MVKRKEEGDVFFSPISIVKPPRVFGTCSSIFILIHCDHVTVLLHAWHYVVWLKKIMLQVLLKHRRDLS